MKKLLISAATLTIIIGCTKRTELQSSCLKVYDLKEVWQDSAKNLMRVDTVWQSHSVVCGSELQRFEAIKPYWVHQCAYQPEFWEHYFIVVSR